MGKRIKKHVSITLNPEALIKLNKLAEKLKTPRNQVVEALIMNLKENRGKNQPLEQEISEVDQYLSKVKKRIQ